MNGQTLMEFCRALPLLKRCGTPVDGSIDEPVLYAASWDEARKAFYETGRDYLKVEAQGDLTSWLAKHHYEKYGGVWNVVAQEYAAIVGPIAESLQLSEELPKEFATDIRSFLRNLVVLYGMECYFAAFPKRPQFFVRLMRILEAGRFPCGCSLPWPTKQIIVY